MKTQPKIYVIRDKLTGEYCVFGSKCAWVNKGAAKNAFNLHMQEYYDGRLEFKRNYWDNIEHLFDKQGDYEIVEI